MNNFGQDYPYAFCYVHPSEVVVGVCAACLTEKLLVLATKQGHALPKETCSGPFTRAPSRNRTIAIPKVFALGSSLFHRFDSRHRRPGDDGSGDGSVLSLDDSFISIKFENNGQVSWDKKPENRKLAGTNPSAASRGPLQDPLTTATTPGDLSMVDHARLQPRGGIRWRKRIGHLFQLVRWRRSSKAAAASQAGVNSAGRVQGPERKGWIRNLTRRRTTE